MYRNFYSWYTSKVIFERNPLLLGSSKIWPLQNWFATVFDTIQYSTHFNAACCRWKGFLRVDIIDNIMGRIKNNTLDLVKRGKWRVFRLWCWYLWYLQNYNYFHNQQLLAKVSDCKSSQIQISWLLRPTRRGSSRSFGGCEASERLQAAAGFV